MNPTRHAQFFLVFQVLQERLRAHLPVDSVGFPWRAIPLTCAILARNLRVRIDRFFAAAINGCDSWQDHCEESFAGLERGG